MVEAGSSGDTQSRILQTIDGHNLCPIINEVRINTVGVETVARGVLSDKFIGQSSIVHQFIANGQTQFIEDIQLGVPPLNVAGHVPASRGRQLCNQHLPIGIRDGLNLTGECENATADTIVHDEVASAFKNELGRSPACTTDIGNGIADCIVLLSDGQPGIICEVGKRGIQQRCDACR